MSKYGLWRHKDSGSYQVLYYVPGFEKDDKGDYLGKWDLVFGDLDHATSIAWLTVLGVEDIQHHHIDPDGRG